jgi:hypothetical protein
MVEWHWTSIAGIQQWEGGGETNQFLLLDVHHYLKVFFLRKKCRTESFEHFFPNLKFKIRSFNFKSQDQKHNDA